MTLEKTNRKVTFIQTLFSLTEERLGSNKIAYFNIRIFASLGTGRCLVTVFPLSIYGDYVCVLVFRKHTKVRQLARLLSFPACVGVIAVQECLVHSLQYNFQQS